jgi:hypothetical protein
MASSLSLPLHSRPASRGAFNQLFRRFLKPRSKGEQTHDALEDA